MGQVLHGSARTTAAVRRAIQHSQESLNKLADRYDINPKTVKEHLYNFLNAYNFAKRLKTLQGLTPYEYIIKCWQKEPKRFKINPSHHKVGLNT